MTLTVKPSDVSWFPVVIGLTGAPGEYDERIKWVDDMIKNHNFHIVDSNVFPYEHNLYVLILLEKKS